MSVCIHTQTSTPSNSPPSTDPNILINMESQEQEAMAANSSTDDGPTPVIFKRRRTKRHTVPLPPLTAVTTAADSSSASSADESGITDVEEDMANCLILLARGHATEDCGGGSGGKSTSRKFAEAATTAGGRAEFYVYECKTCSKCFPSFQALGGHRASHKKLKMATAEPAASLRKVIVDEGHVDQKSTNSFSKTLASSCIGAGGKAKVHECSICGSAFSSGQALGGHMRRHRPASQPEDNKEQKKEKNVLLVDLNLPAPVDDDNTFAAAGKPLIFSAAISAVLVDCQY